jgi:His-Xaa-Ser system protein HxsD
MISGTLIKGNSIQFDIDHRIYDDSVISKALYWYVQDYLIYQEMIDNQVCRVTLEKKMGDITADALKQLKDKFNQDLVDFKVRGIVNKETRDIRNILYVKAFANNDDFEDFNLMGE